MPNTLHGQFTYKNHVRYHIYNYNIVFSHITLSQCNGVLYRDIYKEIMNCDKTLWPLNNQYVKVYIIILFRLVCEEELYGASEDFT